MSNATAISAVTGALASLLSKAASLHPALSDLQVLTTGPGQVSAPVTQTTLNVFLYQVQPDAALRNMSVSRPVPAGSAATPAPAIPPVALALNYLVSAYGKNNDDTLAHLALGMAMSLLGDNAILAPQLIQQAPVNQNISGIDLYLQRERVRVTPLSVAVEDIFKLWSTFQTQYHISVVYQVSVVLIDSMWPEREALPVLAPRSAVSPGRAPPYPVLTAAAPPYGQPSARLGDTITLRGHGLAGSGDGMVVNFASATLGAPSPIPVADANRSASSLTVQIPPSSAAQGWAAGVYHVSVSRNDPPGPSGAPGASRTSNAVPLAIAPTLVTPLVQPSTTSTPSTLTVQCSPAIQPQQAVALFVADLEVRPVVPSTSTTSTSSTTSSSSTTSTSTSSSKSTSSTSSSSSSSTTSSSLQFPIATLPSGTSYVRLRVDGVESFVVSYQAVPLVFDSTQVVTLP